MTIQGGGGPKGPRFPVAPAGGPARSTPTTSADEGAGAPDPFAGDSFEGKITGAWPAITSAEARLDELLARPPERASGIRSMARVLEQTQARLVEEHQALRAELAERLRAVSEAGFSPEAVARVEGELAALRARMGKLRRRLSRVRRRMKLASVQAGQAGEPQLAQGLRASLDQVAAMAPGLDRSLAALKLAARLRPRGPDGEPTRALRLDVADADERPELGSAFAQAAPDAAVARHLASLLGRDAGPAPEGKRLPRSMSELAAFADVQTGSAL